MTTTADEIPTACNPGDSASGCVELHSKSSALVEPSWQKMDAPNGRPPNSGEVKGHSTMYLSPTKQIANPA